MMPPHLATGGTPLFEAPATAKAAANATAKAFGTSNAQNLAKVQSASIGQQNIGQVRPPNVPKLLLGPSLTQQKANQTNAAAAKMGGSVPKAQAQVTGLYGHQSQLQNPQQQPNAGPGIITQDEYQSALSEEEVPHVMPFGLGYEPPIDPALRVAAVRHHVPQ